MDGVDLGAWWPVLVAALASVAVVSAPGVHTARVLGFDAVDSLCLGPALGYTYLLTAGLGATLLGFSWMPLVATCSFVATWVVGVLVARLLARRWRRDDDPATHLRWGSRSVPLLGLLVLASAAATATAIVAGVRAPEAIPQLGDTLFHVQAVDLLASTHDANFFASGNAVWYSPLQYPGGFHVLASTLDGWTGLSTLAASHAALLVFCAAVWPLSVTFLVRAVLGSRGPWLVAGPLLAASLQFVPAYFLGTGGPLWSHLASLALLPVALGCVALVVLRTSPPEPAVLLRAGAAAGVAMCAVIACQPNGLYSVALVGLPLSAPTVLRWGRPWRIAWAAGLLVAALAWSTTRAAMLDIQYPVRDTWLDAALQYAGGSPTFGVAGAAFALLLLAGMVVSARDPRLRGLPLAWCAAAVLAVAARLGDGFLRLTWPWWSDPSRIVALLSVVSLCLVAVGLAWFVAAVRSALVRRPSGALLAVLTLVPLVVASSVATARTTGDGYRPPDAADWWVTDAELAALDQLSDAVPAGSVVAMSPFRGATFISLQGVRPVPMGPRYPLTVATERVENELDHLLDSPEVCAAAESLGLAYAITGGDIVAEGVGIDSDGIEAVADSDDFPVVATAGPYTLHRVPACPARAD